MRRSPAILLLAAALLLSGCSLVGAKVSPGATTSAAAAQKPPVSSAAFDTYIANPGIVGDFTVMDGTTSSTNTAGQFLRLAQETPCLASYMDKLSLAPQAGYLRDDKRLMYLMEFRFPSNDQAAAVQSITADMIQCVSKSSMGLTLSPMGSVKAGGTDYPVYSTLSGNVYRVTVLTVRNITAVVIVRGESYTPIDAMASEVYESINRLS